MKVFRSSKRKKNGLAYFFIFPVLLMTIGFLFYPMLSVFYYGLHDYSTQRPNDINFIGLQHYINMATNDPLLWQSLIISIKWVVYNIFFQCVIGMAAALLISREFKGRGLVRTILISPYAVSGILASALWLFIFQDNFGLMNDLLKKIGFITQNISWTGNLKYSLSAAVTAETWRNMPFFVIIFTAGLQSISIEYYEAAIVDGANSVRRFISITLPFLKETIVYTCILRAAWEFSNIDVIYTLTKGGPVNATTTLAMYVVKVAIKGNDFGYGSALTVASFFLLTLFTFVFIKIAGLKKEDLI